MFLGILFNKVVAQKNDTLRTTIDTVKAKRAVNKAIYSSARKAAILSAVIPSAGQAYNRQYWKMPVIYVALGGLGYWGVTNNIKYKYYSKNLRALNDDDPNTVNVSNYSNSQLITQKNFYKKYRDIAIIFSALVYTLNIIDANVSAHLKTFDVSDDLSLQFKPYSTLDYNNNLQAGLTLKFNFK